MGLMHGCIARVYRKKECDASSSQVGGFVHEDAKMSVGAASSRGVDMSGIGVELLLEEAQGRVGGFTNDGSEFRMRKGQAGAGGDGHGRRRKRAAKGSKGRNKGWRNCFA